MWNPLLNTVTPQQHLNFATEPVENITEVLLNVLMPAKALTLVFWLLRLKKNHTHVSF